MRAEIDAQAHACVRLTSTVTHAFPASGSTLHAANALGVSRQYLVRLLEEGEIPFHHTGTHRRVFSKDIARY